MRLKKGDNVIMLNGKDRLKKGKVIAVLPAGNRVIIGGLNLIKKAVRARQQGQKGQIIHKERAVSATSVALICPSCGKPTRVGYRLEGGQKARICRKCKTDI